jgi:hypothetical protein
MSQIFYTISTTLDNDDEVIDPPAPTVLSNGEPGPNTNIYGSSLVITRPTKIKAMNVGNASLVSPITSVYYSKLTLPPAKAEPVAFLPNGVSDAAPGTQYSVLMASASPGVTIYYRLVAPGENGEVLDVNGDPVVDAISTANNSTITVVAPIEIRAQCKGPGYIPSDLTLAVFDQTTPKLGTPVIDPNGAIGMIDDVVPVTVTAVLADGTSPALGSTIHYIFTELGSSPPDVLDSNGVPLPGVTSVSGPETTINAVIPSWLHVKTTAPGYLPSDKASARFLGDAS